MLHTFSKEKLTPIIYYMNRNFIRTGIVVSVMIDEHSIFDVHMIYD